jgi:predicted nucleic acid-binding protein
MTRLLVDVNVILDILLDRKPHAEASAAAWAAVERGMAQGFVAAHAITTIHYLVRKETSTAKSKAIVTAILKVFHVAPIDDSVLQDALQLSCSDFEDAATAAAARLASCDYIVTRDPRGFRGSPVRSVTPEAVPPLLAGS